MRAHGRAGSAPDAPRLRSRTFLTAIGPAGGCGTHTPRTGGDTDGVAVVLGARRARADQPLTAPCRPLTIRFCKARKNTSAGVIASDVNARNPGGSDEDWLEDCAPPSGGGIAPAPTFGHDRGSRQRAQL